MNHQLTAHFIIHDDFSHINRALMSLRDGTQQPHAVWVTINRGAAEQVAAIGRRWPTVDIQQNAAPQGFAANHNAAMRRCQTPYIALLNDDIAVHPAALDHIMAYLEANPDVGLCSPQIVNPDGSAQLSSFSDLSLLRALYKISGLGKLTPHGGLVRRLMTRTGLARLLGLESLRPTTPADQQPRDVPVAVGVAMVVRRSAYESAGMMDEDTVMYGEEYGWHYRLRQAGWRVVLLPGATVTHYNPTTDLTGWKLAEHRKSLIALFTRYKPRWQSWLIRSAIVFFHSLYALLNWPFNRAESRAHAQAVRMALAFKLASTTP